MKQQLDNIKAGALVAIKDVKTAKELEDIRIKYLGKKGELTSILRGMGALSKDDRPIIGKIANDVREAIEEALDSAISNIKNIEKEIKLQNEVIDISLPGKKPFIGRRHPLELTLNKMKEIFIEMGFTIEEGPEVELDHYNFEALNIPKNHPARSEQDTFYINDEVVLRTQTSPVQARVMENQKPPIKMISPGKVYRSDVVDATHSPIFYQMEGLVIDKGITFADLKGTLDLFAKKMFGENVKTKFRPHHFPFTEPSAEVDVYWGLETETDYRMTKGTGWLEIMGCGMVDPNVLRNVDIDPEKYSGYAFGMGIERIALLLYQIGDIRLYTENDKRFLEQFRSELF